MDQNKLTRNASAWRACMDALNTAACEDLQHKHDHYIAVNTRKTINLTHGLETTVIVYNS